MERSLDRRTFTLEFALAALSGVVITISGCGGGSYGSPSGPSGGSSGDKVGSISYSFNIAERVASVRPELAHRLPARPSHWSLRPGLPGLVGHG